MTVASPRERLYAGASALVYGIINAYFARNLYRNITVVGKTIQKHEDQCPEKRWLSTTLCYLSALNGKALIFGGVDLFAKTAALNVAVVAALISVALVAIGCFLLPPGAPNAMSENPL